MGAIIARDTLNLHGDVLDAEAMLDAGCERGEESVVAAFRAHQMGGERRLCRAHGPDVQIVHGDNARLLGQKAAHGGDINAARGRVEHEIKRFNQ